jgi:hypothetical protein
MRGVQWSAGNADGTDSKDTAPITFVQYYECC